MSFLTNIFSGGAAQLVEKVGDVVDKVTTTKEEKMQLDLEFRKAEMQFQQEMQRLNVEERKLILDDKNSARQMATSVQTNINATKLNKNVTGYLALGTTLITFTLFGLVIFCKNYFDSDAKDVVLYILGVLSAILTQIYSFYFGSSMGSDDKNTIIQNMSNNALKQ